LGKGRLGELEIRRLGELEIRRLGEKEKRRIYPIISPTPDKPGCRQWISNPCDPVPDSTPNPSKPEFTIPSQSPEVGGKGDLEKRRRGDLGKRRQGESTP
jgi:hypothetical protein